MSSRKSGRSKNFTTKFKTLVTFSDEGYTFALTPGLRRSDKRSHARKPSWLRGGETRAGSRATESHKNYIKTLNLPKNISAPHAPHGPLPPSPRPGGAEGTPPSPRMGRGGTQFAPLRPAAWGIHPAGGESVFPPSRSRPALLGKGAAWTAAHGAPACVRGDEVGRTQGPLSLRVGTVLS